MAITYLPYAQQSAAVERQRRLAEMLQQQANEPLEIQQTGRIAARLPSYAPLIKALQGLAAGYVSKKAGEAETALKQQGQQEARQSVQDLITAMGPQKSFELKEAAPVEARPYEYKDFQNEADYEAYRNSPEFNQPNMVKQTEFNPVTGKNEPIMERTEITKPGLSRNEALARILQMQTSENPYTAQIAPALTALLPKETEIGAIDPADWTPESLQIYKGSGKYSDLVAKNESKTRTPTEFELKYALAQKENPNLTYSQFVKMNQAGPTTVIQQPTTNKYTEKVATSLAEKEDATLAASETATDRIATSHRIKSILEQNPITGGGANFKLQAKNLAVLAGLADPNDSEIVATNKLIAEMAKATLDNVKSSGLGSGQGFTEGDRNFLEKATIGNVEQGSDTILYLVNKMEQAARESIKKGNAIRARRRGMPEFKGMPGAFDDIPMPAEYSSGKPYGSAPQGAVRPRG